MWVNMVDMVYLDGLWVNSDVLVDNSVIISEASDERYSLWWSRQETLSQKWQSFHNSEISR